MPSNALQSTIVAALAPIVAAVFLLIHVNESSNDQSVIVLGAASLVAVIFGIYAAFAHHGSNQVKIAKAKAANTTFTATSTSGGSVTTPILIDHRPAQRVRKSRAKPKTPPAA